MPPRDKSDLKTNGRSTEPPRRSRRAAALMVAATTAVLLSANVLWYRTHSGAIASAEIFRNEARHPLFIFRQIVDELHPGHIGRREHMHR